MTKQGTGSTVRSADVILVLCVCYSVNAVGIVTDRSTLLTLLFSQSAFFQLSAVSDGIFLGWRQSPTLIRRCPTRGSLEAISEEIVSELRARSSRRRQLIPRARLVHKNLPTRLLTRSRSLHEEGVRREDFWESTLSSSSEAVFWRDNSSCTSLGSESPTEYNFRHTEIVDRAYRPFDPDHYSPDAGRLYKSASLQADVVNTAYTSYDPDHWTPLYKSISVSGTIDSSETDELKYRKNSKVEDQKKLKPALFKSNSTSSSLHSNHGKENRLYTKHRPDFMKRNLQANSILRKYSTESSLDSYNADYPLRHQDRVHRDYRDFEFNANKRKSSKTSIFKSKSSNGSLTSSKNSDYSNFKNPLKKTSSVNSPNALRKHTSRGTSDCSQKYDSRTFVKSKGTPLKTPSNNNQASLRKYTTSENICKLSELFSNNTVKTEKSQESKHSKFLDYSKAAKKIKQFTLSKGRAFGVKKDRPPIDIRNIWNFKVNDVSGNSSTSSSASFATEICNEEYLTSCDKLTTCSETSTSATWNTCSDNCEEDNGTDYYYDTCPVATKSAGICTLTRVKKLEELNNEEPTTEGSNMSRRPQVLHVKDSANSLPRRKSSDQSTQINAPVIVAKFTVAGECTEVLPDPEKDPNCQEVKFSNDGKQLPFRMISCSEEKTANSEAAEKQTVKTFGRSVPENLHEAHLMEADLQDHTSNKVAAFDGLMQYLQEYRHGLRELLVNNNVVIIEPIRETPNRDERKIKSAQGFASKASPGGTCRIAGVTVKKSYSVNGDEMPQSQSHTLPRQQKDNNQQPILRRHFFYYPKRSNKELLDEELPDPDTVKNTRELFEKTLKMKTPADIAMSKLSSSIQSVSKSITNVPSQVSQKNLEDSTKATPAETSNTRKVNGRMLTADNVSKHNRWSDSGSLSSGVSSDLSCYDTDLETSSRNSLHKEDVFSSDGDEEVYKQNECCEEDGDGHYVSPDVLEKIRACGTSITYYGGRIIASTKGTQVSPMTLAIMDEIRRTNDCSGTYSKRKKVFPDDYLGVRFRLVKSNSCGSRLELAGTEEQDSSNTNSQDEQVLDGNKPKKNVSKQNGINFWKRCDTKSHKRHPNGEKFTVNSKVNRLNSIFHEMEFEEFEILDETQAENHKTNGQHTAEGCNIMNGHTEENDSKNNAETVNEVLVENNLEIEKNDHNLSRKPSITIEKQSVNQSIC